MVLLLVFTALSLGEVQPIASAPRPLTVAAGPRDQQGRARNGPEHAVPLAFGEVFAPGPDLTLSEKVRSLRGRRVRMEGYAARLEDAPAGGFWLTPLPVKGDESGAGMGDLPPGAVLVLVRSAGARPILPATSGLISVSGVLEVGHGAASGQSSLLRIVLDRPLARAARPVPARSDARAPSAPHRP